MSLLPKKAKREKLIAAVAVMGASGAGKTLGALLTAYGMMKEKYPELSEEEIWDKIGLIDTEHERALVYEGMEYNDHRIGQFFHINFEKPYTISRLDQAVKGMKQSGVEVLVIDSLSHFWEDTGGILDLQQQKGGNFQAWRDVNPEYKNFIALCIGEKHRIHTLSTMRLKQEYGVETNEVGKLEIKKMGLKPVQRDSLEYEFQVVFNVDMNHKASATKDNSGIFEAPHKLSPETGARLIKWLDKGDDVKGEEEAERLSLIELTVGLAAEKNVEDIIATIEKKMKQKLEDFPLTWVQLAYQRVMDADSKVKVEA